MQAKAYESKNRLAFLGAMVGGLAHELKNPLSTLNLNLQLLMEDLSEPANVRERRILKKLELLKSETSRLESILEDFLRFARPRALRPELVSVTSLLDEALDFVEPSLRKRSITTHRLYAQTLELYPLDRSYFKIVVVNLLVNAKQAMAGRGGELIVRVDRNDHGIEVHVIDTGPGIPPDNLARVFDAYFSTKRKGTGMGLALARRVVEEHGGTLSVDSEVGKGTDFRIDLPLPPTLEAASE
jgi:signal transduction histidine kinase